MAHESDQWHTPPENQGQGVEVQYRYRATDDTLWKRRIDHSDPGDPMEFEVADGSDDCLAAYPMDFWNGRPPKMTCFFPAQVPVGPWE